MCLSAHFTGKFLAFASCSFSIECTLMPIIFSGQVTIEITNLMVGQIQVLAFSGENYTYLLTYLLHGAGYYLKS
jgi:hypothetical protein